MELDDLPKERLKQLIFEETGQFVQSQQQGGGTVIFGPFRRSSLLFQVLL